MPVRLLQSQAAEPLAIDYRSIGSLIPYARNARTHSEAQAPLIAGSIRDFGFTSPVLVDGEGGGLGEGDQRHQQSPDLTPSSEFAATKRRGADSIAKPATQ